MKKAYLETTNICNLACDFCPGTKRAGKFMSPEEFRLLAGRLRPHTQYLYLHLMGEPLLHPELPQLLSIGADLGFRLCITTNGTLLARTGKALLDCPALHKVSISLHSQEGNGLFDRTYLEEVWRFCRAASERDIMCVLRLWNLEGKDSRNQDIFAFFEEKLGRSPLSCPVPRPGSHRLMERVDLEEAQRFDWPDLDAPPAKTTFCQGLRDHIGVLVDGTVVPCCLDHEGDIPLGNLLQEELTDILSSPRAKALYDGFSRRTPSEELCRRCGYASRF